MENLLGKQLKHDVTTGLGLVLIPANTILTREHLPILERHRIHPMDIFIYQASIQDPTVNLIYQATNYSKDLFTRIQTKGNLPLLDVKQELVPLVQEVSAQPDVYRLFHAIQAKEDYTHYHNIGVGVLSTLIGGWMNLDKQEMELLTLAAVVYDVGKAKIPEQILHKPGKLTPEEFKEMRRHTVYGYELLKEAGFDHRVALTALQHHERMDGTGYPLRLNERHLDQICRIVAFADIFHAMSSNRPYEKALPFFEVIRQMRTGYFGHLDPSIIGLFMKNLIHHLVGREVTLNNGRTGRIVYINPHDEMNPLVQIGDAFLDLSKDRNILIHDVIA